MTAVTADATTTSSTADIVSVVIPTLGRAALHAAVESALAQDVPVDVVVVNDSGAPLAQTFDDPAVRVVSTTGHTGAAAARNAGLEAVNGTLVAFLDDDDVWLPGHLAAAVGYLRDHPGTDIYCCRGIVRYSGEAERVEPVDSMGDQTVLDYTFGPGAFVRRGRRVLTPTIVFRRSLAGHRFDPTLDAYEDTWWLLTAEKAGHRVHQSENVGIVVDASRDRNHSRMTTDLLEGYCRRLETIHPGTGVRQLLVTARGEAWRGNPRGVLQLARVARRIPHHRRALPVFGAAAAAACGTAGLARARRARA